MSHFSAMRTRGRATFISVRCGFLIASFLLAAIPAARAAITPIGEVQPYPLGPMGWTTYTACEVGVIGGGTLTVDGGSSLLSYVCYIGDQSTATGLVTISGAGSSWTGLSFVHIGLYGSGTLSILAGGSVNSTNSPPGDVVYLSTLAYSPGATGVVAVDGTGSNWTTSGVAVGGGGSGTISITNGATVTSGFDFIGGPSLEPARGGRPWSMAVGQHGAIPASMSAPGAPASCRSAVADLSSVGAAASATPPDPSE